MTDIQLLTIVLTLLAIFGSVLANRKSIEDMRDVLRAESREQSATIYARLQGIENKIDHLVEIVASHSERLDGGSK